MACGLAVTERFGGQVPDTMDELVTLPGVGGRPPMSLLGNAFGQPAIIVDTHVKRVSNRLGLTTSADPVQIEKDLQQLLPPTQWTGVSQRLLLHGRYLCLARKPQCGSCPIYDYLFSQRESPEMIRSMTGFGRKQAPWQDGSVTVEIRSVNHRFLEVACRLPRALTALEDVFKKAIQQRCFRGRIDMSVTIQGGKGRAGAVNLDHTLAKQYHQALRVLKKTLKLTGSIDVALIAGLRDVVSVSDQPPDDPKLAKLVQQLATEALDDLQAMRNTRATPLPRT